MERSSPENRILMLQRKPVGGILAVVQHWDSVASTLGPVIIRLLAAPATATLGKATPPIAAGLILSDVWDSDIVVSVLGDLPLMESCPLMVETAGLLRNMGDISMAHILKVTAPVFIPDDHAVSAQVTQGAITVNRALFLPELAHMPVSQCWPVEGLTMQDILDSIQMLTASSKTVMCAPFITLLSEEASVFQAWLDAVKTKPSDFNVLARHR